MTPGYKTPAFWASLVLTAIGGVTASGAVVDGGTVASLLGVAGAALTSSGYASFRQFAKASDGVKRPWYRSTEFLLSVASASALAAQAAVLPGTRVYTIAGAVLTIVGYFGRGFLPPRAAR